MDTIELTEISGLIALKIPTLVAVEDPNPQASGIERHIFRRPFKRALANFANSDTTDLS